MNKDKCCEQTSCERCPNSFDCWKEMKHNRGNGHLLEEYVEAF